MSEQAFGIGNMTTHDYLVFIDYQDGAGRIIAHCGEEQDRDMIVKALEGNAELLRRVEAAEKKARKMLSLAHQMTGHQQHWDDTMQHGTGCPLCIRQREILREMELLAPAAQEDKQA